MPRQLYLLRHAETLFNRQNKTQGWCDSPLTERGIEQAKIAVRILADRGLSFTHAYSSTSERCCDTLEIATTEAYGAPLPYERCKGLREFGFGAFEGKDNFLEPGFPRGDFYLRYGGESEELVTERMVSTLTDIMERPGHDSVLAVTSGGAARIFLVSQLATAKDKPRFFCNCMAYLYEYDNGVFTCLECIIPDLSPLEEPSLPKQIRPINPDIARPWTHY